MKLGISYVIFEGEELLEYALRPIRNQVDFVSVVCADISHIGERRGPDLREHLEKLKSERLIDSIIDQEYDARKTWRENEIGIRRLGLEASRHAGCSHHLAADVDEFYESGQFKYVKGESEGWDGSVVYLENYYKSPNWLVTPWQKHMVSFIFPVENELEMGEFPHPVEPTRRLKRFDRLRKFAREEFIVHHMSFVRRDMMRKLRNSPNISSDKIGQFSSQYNTYQVGERLILPPDFSFKRTRYQFNNFGIPEELWDRQIQQDQV